MSDDEEYEYDYGSDADYDYGSDQGGEEVGEGNDDLIEIENCFYGKFILSKISLNSMTKVILEGEDLKTENPRKAIEMFEKVVALETKLGDQVKR
jgi:hypothetical protein